MKILGIDYGRRKIGAAIGDTETKLACPLPTVKNFQSTIKDQKVQKIIIGLPNGKMDEEIKTFGEKLRQQTKVEIEYIDETLTTQDAQKILIESGRSRQSRKKKEDAVAAAIMLQYYLETNTS